MTVQATDIVIHQAAIIMERDQTIQTLHQMLTQERLQRVKLEDELEALRRTPVPVEPAPRPVERTDGYVWDGHA
jgi:hypothetical protein